MIELYERRMTQKVTRKGRIGTCLIHRNDGCPADLLGREQTYVPLRRVPGDSGTDKKYLGVC